MNQLMRPARFALLCLSMAVWPASVGAVESTGTSPDHLVHVWRSEDGLPHNSILSLAQTPDGYIWIGTRSGGLARFDGLRFVSFNPQNTPELHDVEIEELSVDSNGTMWIATGNESLSTYRDGKFTLIREERAIPRWHPTRVVAASSNQVLMLSRGGRIFQLPDAGPLNQAARLEPAHLTTASRRLYAQSGQGTLWFLDARRQLCTTDGPTIQAVPATELPIAGPFEDIAVDPSGQIWVANEKSMIRLGREGWSIQAPTNGPAPGRIHRIIPAGTNSIWVCEAGRIRRMSEGQWVASAPGGLSLPAPARNQWTVFGDRAGGLWCLDYAAGLIHIQPDGKHTLLTVADGLPSVGLTAWLEDDEGNVWLGTVDSGLARIRPRVFQVYDASRGLPDEAVQSVCEDRNGTIWVGTVHGQLARLREDRFEPVGLGVPDASIVDCVTVFPSANGSLWVGTQKGGLYSLTQGESSEDFTIQSAAPGWARLIMEDSSGRVWIGSGAGLRVLEHGVLKTLGNRDGFRTGFGIGGMTEDSSGAVWIGSGPGELWEYRDGKFTSFSPPKAWPQGRFTAMLAETNGVVWIGTLGNGLVRFANGEFTRITSAQGLPNDFITQLLEDDDGDLWAGTYAGIFKAEKAALTATATGQSPRVTCWKFGRFDGLPSVECSGGFFHPASWRGQDGRLWFATLQGLASVDPREVTVFRRPPPVRIEDFRINGVSQAFSRARADGTRQKGPVIQIEPGRHALQFRFTAFNYTAPDDVRFQWRLEGAAPDWQDVGQERQVSFAPLPPGSYRFQVRAANSSGEWSEDRASQAFLVRPFFWETMWFKASTIAGSFALFTLLVGLSLRRRYRLRLERWERQREVERERARIAQDLHDDLGTNLTQISLLSALVSREGTPREEVGQIARDIRAKSRQMVSGLNEIVWAVNPRNDSWNDVLGYFGNYAGEFLSATPIRCRLDLPDQVIERQLPAEVRHNLYLAFKEALNNAAKYSEATEITLQAREDRGEIIISVKDNGRGIQPARTAGPGGNGLRNMHARLEKIGGRCEIESSQGTGTTVRFHLPK